MAQLEEILNRHWGYASFRPLQKEIITSVLEGNDTLALLPTGGGKSICFQVPALAREGLCIVVSPLIALMKDQVENLKKRDIPAMAIYSGMSRADVIRTLKNATGNYHKFLYVSPERLETSLFNEYLPAMNVTLIAVDESHCISQWGYDFRPSYLRIAELRQQLPGIPVVALTASATPQVQKDICEKLEFRNGRVFRQGFERKNLSYSVFRVDSKLSRLTEIIKKVPGTSIVYCKSRKRTTEVMQLLQLQGIVAENYHAGLSADERNKKQKDWIDNKVRCIVCTNAFGMGIDKPDVRLVVHLDPPDCLENYYQEAGRAGRDEKKAYAVLLHDQRDVEEIQQLHKVRFPELETIRQVYHALVNYLQIPVYTGEGQAFPFQFDRFVKNFNLGSNETLYALKALESDGWIDFNERSFTPSTLMFTTSKEGLYAFYNSYPEHEQLLTLLLRTYGGIFDFPVFISETLVAKLAKLDEQQLKEQLQKIQGLGMVRYTPQNDAPQVIFRKHRVKAEELRFDLAAYNRRREVFVHRTTQMIGYLQSAGCRSRFISEYFGDANAGRCGICDNCLKEASTEVSAAEFQTYAAVVERSLQQSALTAEELFATLKGLKKEKAWRLIQFLQAENRIEAGADGRLRLK